jgi:deferrochelatase/peroxidase EfeB
MPTDPPAESAPPEAPLPEAPLPEAPLPAGSVPPPPAGPPRRRAFLRGALSAGVTGVVAGAAGGYAYRATRPAPAGQTALENAEAGVLPPVPFHGKYQAGILPAPQRQTAVISFNVTADRELSAGN